MATEHEVTYTPQEQQHLDVKKQEFQQAVTAANTAQILNLIVMNAANTNVALRESSERMTEDTVQGNKLAFYKPLEGDVMTVGSKKNAVAMTHLYTKEAIKAFRQNPALLPIPAASREGQIVLGVAQAISAPDIQIDSWNAPYISKILTAPLLGPVATPTSILTDEEWTNLFLSSGYLGRKMYATLGQIEGKPEGEINIKLGEFAEKVRAYHRINYERGNVIESATVEILDPKTQAFYQALKEPSLFQQYFQIERNRIITENYPHLTYQQLNDVQKKAVNIQTSQHLAQKTRAVIYQIYKQALTRRKDEEFDRATSGGGIYNPDPHQKFEFFVDGILEGLANGIQSSQGGEYWSPQRKTVTVYDDERGAYRTDEMIDIEHSKVKSEDFIQYLINTARSEQSRLRYGYNLEYLQMNGQYDPKEGVFKSVGNYAGRITSADLDEVFSGDSHDMVQRILNTFEHRNEFMYLRQDWKKNPLLLSEYYDSMTRLEKEAIRDIKARYGNREEWEINRAIFNAKLVMYGMLYKQFHHVSYADPMTTEEGGSTARGDVPASPFDPAVIAKRFANFGGGPSESAWKSALRGVDWLPMNKYFHKHYDHNIAKDFRKRWLASHEQGQAAYYKDGKDITLDEWKETKLYIDIGNITGAGGWDKLSGWRIFYAYRHLLTDTRLRDAAGNAVAYINEKDAVRSDAPPEVFVHMWKLLENTGLDVLENFNGKFIHGTAKKSEVAAYNAEVKKLQEQGLDMTHLSEESKKFVQKKERILTLYGFLYDRYFTTEAGRPFIAVKDGNNNLTNRVISRNEYLTQIKEMFESEKYYNYEREGKLKEWANKALSVAFFERMPMKFLTLEKPRKTQNGLTLYSELAKDFAGEADPARKDVFDKAVDDLLFVEIEVRMRSMKTMSEWREAGRNLYGADINSLRSDLNYIVDDAAIENILRTSLPIVRNEQNQSLTQAEINERIQNARTVYQNLRSKLSVKPAEAKWEHEAIAGNALVRKNALRKTYETRMEWFNRMYAGDWLGFSPTSGETAWKFLNLSATGKDTLKRVANYDADTAEAVSKQWATEALGLLEKAGKEHDTHLKEYYESVKKVKELIEGQADDRLGGKVGKLLLQRGIYFFRYDDVNPLTYPISDQLDPIGNVSRSFYEEGTIGGPRARVGRMRVDKNVIDGIIGEAEGKIFPIMADEPMVKRGKKHKFWKFEWTDPDVRDVVNEVSGKALREMNKSGPSELFKYEILPRLLLIMLAIMAILGIKGFKSDFIGMGGGGKS